MRRSRHRPVRCGERASAGRARKRTRRRQAAETPKLPADADGGGRARPRRRQPRTHRTEYARRGSGRAQTPVGLRQLLGADQTSHDGHIADGEEHADGLAQRQHDVQQPDPRAEEPHQRDQPVQHHPYEVAGDQQPASVDPVDQHSGEDPRRHRRGAAHRGQQTHARHRARGLEDQQGQRDQGEGVTEDGEGLGSPEDAEVPLFPKDLTPGGGGGVVRAAAVLLRFVRRHRPPWNPRQPYASRRRPATEIPTHPRPHILRRSRPSLFPRKPFPVTLVDTEPEHRSGSCRSTSSTPLPETPPP